MAGTNTPIFPQTIQNWAATIAPAQTTTLVTLASGGVNGSKIESLIISSSATSLYDAQFVVAIGATNYVLTTIPVPTTSGTVDSVASVDVLRSTLIPGLAYDSNGNKYLYIASGSILYVSSLTTLSYGKLQIFAQGGSY